LRCGGGIPARAAWCLPTITRCFALLHDAPNADMSAAEFWTALGVSLCTYGNAYAEVQRTSNDYGGRVVALTPLRPELMTVRRGESGAIEYRYADPRATARDIPETTCCISRA
jgi:phage portal protein BeeE